MESPLADNEIRAFTHQILRGVGYIHSAGVVLQDLTPEHILVSEEGSIKIGALGSSSYSVAADDNFDERLVKPYQAPELSLGYSDLVRCRISLLGIRAFIVGTDYSYECLVGRMHHYGAYNRGANLRCRKVSCL